MFPDTEEMQDPIESQEVYVKAEKNTSNDHSTHYICINSFNNIHAVQTHQDVCSGNVDMACVGDLLPPPKYSQKLQFIAL
jgi:hypothetical protein